MGETARDEEGGKATQSLYVPALSECKVGWEDEEGGKATQSLCLSECEVGDEREAQIALFAFSE